MEAEDIAQEAFLKCFAALPRLENEFSFVYWLNRIVPNLCADRLRKRSKERIKTASNEALDAFEISVAQEQQRVRNLKSTIEEAMRQLSSDHRPIILLHDVQGVEAGDEPFGSVLVAGDGTVLMEDRNRVARGDPTQHPEFALARWSANRLTPEQRSAATVYTSGEHCPMCAAAHGWVGLGRIVYASSFAQLAEWFGELGVAVSKVRTLRIQDVIRIRRSMGRCRSWRNK